MLLEQLQVFAGGTYCEPIIVRPAEAAHAVAVALRLLVGNLALHPCDQHLAQATLREARHVGIDATGIDTAVNQRHANCEQHEFTTLVAQRPAP